MKKYLYIAIGGTLGSLARYGIKTFPWAIWHNGFPLGTLLINLSGSFLLGFFLALTFDYLDMDPDIRIGIATGFFGAYTTFSSYCKESILLLEHGKIVIALSYICLSALLGVGLCLAGMALARLSIRHLSGELA